MGTEARLTTPSADHGGGRAAAGGPLLKRSLSFPLPSVHEEIADDLGQSQAGDQATAAPPGEDRPHAHGLPPAPLALKVTHCGRGTYIYTQPRRAAWGGRMSTTGPGVGLFVK